MYLRSCFLQTFVTYAIPPLMIHTNTDHGYSSDARTAAIAGSSLERRPASEDAHTHADSFYVIRPSFVHGDPIFQFFPVYFVQPRSGTVLYHAMRTLSSKSHLKAYPSCLATFSAPRIPRNTTHVPPPPPPPPHPVCRGTRAHAAPRRSASSAAHRYFASPGVRCVTPSAVASR